MQERWAGFAVLRPSGELLRGCVGLRGVPAPEQAGHRLLLIHKAHYTLAARPPPLPEEQECPEGAFSHPHPSPGQGKLYQLG